jgi:hypothetical protein
MPQGAEFDKLEEDDQYTYLEELAPRMSKMCVQQGPSLSRALPVSAAISDREVLAAMLHSASLCVCLSLSLRVPGT